MSTTFTKFDAIGAALSELSFDNISLQFARYSTGSNKYSVFLHYRGEQCTIGEADTPSAALENALARFAEKQAEAVERAAA